jgi:DNA-binding response OmpR family regulator
MQTSASPPLILLVNEDMEYLESLRLLLKGRGYDARVSHTVEGSVSDGVDAFVVHSGFRDVGEARAEQLIRKARAVAGSLPLLVVTTVLNATDRKRFMDLDVDGVLEKPISGRELFEALSALGVLPPGADASEGTGQGRTAGPPR